MCRVRGSHFGTCIPGQLKTAGYILGASRHPLSSPFWHSHAGWYFAAFVPTVVRLGRPSWCGAYGLAVRTVWAAAPIV
jgi:hypothetical protein